MVLLAAVSHPRKHNIDSAVDHIKNELHLASLISAPQIDAPADVKLLKNINANAKRILDLPLPTAVTEAATKGYVDAAVAVVPVIFNEHFIGDGVQTEFTLAFPFSPNTTMVYVNGVRQWISPVPGSDDYWESDVDKIKFNTAPASGDLIVVDYLKAPLKQVINEQFIGNGTQTLFTLSREFVEGTTRVFRNGIRQWSAAAGDDYQEIPPNKIKFNTAPLSGDRIVVDFNYLE